MDNLYGLIMVGGGGTRLWPLSRQKRPIQMLALTEDRIMFQISIDRLAPLLLLNESWWLQAAIR